MRREDYGFILTHLANKISYFCQLIWIQSGSWFIQNKNLRIVQQCLSETYALTAYLLNLNKIIGPNDTMNKDTLPKVKMPNRDAFFVVYPGNIK